MIRIVSSVLILVGVIFPACSTEAASFVYDFEDYSFYWRDQSYASPYPHSSGGNPGAFIETHFRDNVFVYPYDSPQAGASGPLVGDLWQEYGNDFSFTVDLKILTPGVSVNVIEYRLTSSAGEWRYCWPGPWTSENGWFTLKAPFLSDTPGLWEKFSSGSWNDVVAGVNKYCMLRVYDDTGDMSLAVDNWGYVPGHDDPPAEPVRPATLTDTVAWWQMKTLDDSVGLNSILTENGSATVGHYDDDLQNLGPGSEGYYASFPSHTDGDYLSADQGEHGRLRIVGPHTFYMRVSFKDLSITQYLFNKYDHAIGPNGLANPGVFLRTEPGGVLAYSVHDGDVGVTTVNLSISGLQTNDTWYDIAAVFDPANDNVALYVMDPIIRSVLFSNTSPVTFNTCPMDTPVPFTIGDRLTWNGSQWVSVGITAMHSDVEMAAVWSQAFNIQQLQDMQVGDAPEDFILGFCMSTDWLERAVCYTEMPTWASHGINSLYVFKMMSEEIIGRLDAYDFIFDIGNENNIAAFAGIHFGMETPANRQTISDYIDAHKNMPGLKGYAAPDEPVDNVDYDDFQDICNLFRERDPAHPVWCEFTSSIRWHQEWIPHVDIASAGTYAIGYGIPMWESTINARRIADMAQDAGLEKSTFLLQCLDYAGQPRPYPTLAQNRYLTYAALSVGNDGVLYYSLEYLQNKTKLDTVIYPVCDELNSLKNVFASRESAPTVTSNRDFDTTGHDVYGYTVNDITYTVRTYHDRIYIVAVNNTESTTSVSFTVDPIPNGVIEPVAVLFETGRTLIMTRNADTGTFDDSFDPYAVHVYEITVNRCGDYNNPYPAGDLSQDCNIDFEDLTLLTQAWLQQYNLEDFALLAGSWQFCTNPIGCQ